MPQLDDGHSECRIDQFARWNRIMLEHERNHLSKHMAASAFMKESEREAFIHDITDIDYILAELHGPPK